MNSARSLLNLSNQNVAPNVTSTNPLYNPEIPVINDINIRELRNIKFKDRYYLDNRIDRQMRNSDGLSLGPNNKYLRRKDYDRQIDPNYLRRENPKNKKHTDPNDFYNGSTLAFLEIPKRIPRATTTAPVIDSMDQYQYKNRFISNPLLTTNTPNNSPDIPRSSNINIPKRKGNSQYDLTLEKIRKQREQDLQDSEPYGDKELPKDLRDVDRGFDNVQTGPVVNKPIIINKNSMNV